LAEQSCTKENRTCSCSWWIQIQLFVEMNINVPLHLQKTPLVDTVTDTLTIKHSRPICGHLFTESPTITSLFKISYIHWIWIRQLQMLPCMFYKI